MRDRLAARCELARADDAVAELLGDALGSDVREERTRRRGTRTEFQENELERCSALLRSEAAALELGA